MSDGTASWPLARSGSELGIGQLSATAEADFARYEVVKDLVDECIDLSLNYRQSGHPGGSRSKVHMLVALLLSGAMRWDLLRPWRRFGDRFVLSAGHTVPLVYATLAVLNEAVRARHERTGQSSFAFPDNGRWALTWEWLLRLRRRGGLPGHAEMEGRTLLLKFTTGPSGQPLFIAASADLAESTNIAGFGQDFGGSPGTGWYERSQNPFGALLPTEITEFTNAGMMAGLATVNLAADPFSVFDGFWGACSTYGSFSYLKYGLMRLFSQLAQDSELKVGKVLWIAGHSGPETAEDSRTHFGIFSIGVTQLLPEGHVIDLHPWEYNEVPVMLGAAFSLDMPIVALHLTRPPVEIPDREALGIPSHLAAAHGAYVLRDYAPDQPRGGIVFVRGTMPTRNLVSVLPELTERGINVKIVAAVSPQLFARQPLDYQRSVASPSERLDAMIITNGAFKLMREWVDGPLVREYSLSSDWDDRWRTGGSVAEVIEEAHLDDAHILAGLGRFAAERADRLRRLRELLDGA